MRGSAPFLETKKTNEGLKNTFLKENFKEFQDFFNHVSSKSQLKIIKSSYSDFDCSNGNDSDCKRAGINFTTDDNQIYYYDEEGHSNFDVFFDSVNFDIAGVNFSKKYNIGFGTAFTENYVSVNVKENGNRASKKLFIVDKIYSKETGIINLHELYKCMNSEGLLVEDPLANGVLYKKAQQLINTFNPEIKLRGSDNSSCESPLFFSKKEWANFQNKDFDLSR
jgi:hypothetical protein